mgnify:CR=1 FL=1
MEKYLYIALFAPLLGSLIAALFSTKPKMLFTGIITSALLAVSMIASLNLLYYVYSTDAIVHLKLMDWIVIGNLNIPYSGDYMFDSTVNGGTYLIINKDTIINMNGNFKTNTTKYGKAYLEKGTVSYHLVYNKPVVWRSGFDLFVEGPKIQRYSLLKNGLTSLNKQNPKHAITLKVKEKTLTQRSFLNHKGIKRSQVAISVIILSN